MSFYFLNISPEKNSGLCNQIYFISSMCTYAIKNNIKYIFLSKFLKEINTDNYCPISEIINIEKTNFFLKKYNIVLFDSFNFKFDIISIKYGNSLFNIDVTDICKIRYKNNNSFCILKGTNLYQLFKECNFLSSEDNLNIMSSSNNKIFLQIKIDDTVLDYSVNTTNGILEKHIHINLNTFEFKTTLNPSIYNDGTFEIKDIIQNISFNEKLLNKADEFFINNKDIILKTDKINVIHLRLEDDILEAMSKTSYLKTKENKYEKDVYLKNNYEKNEYKNLLENKYIKLIRQIIDKNDTTILVSYNYDNEVVQYMDKNNYKYIKTPKFDSNRDVSAIIDMHIGQYCNNIYIGTFESSFSYILYIRMYNKNKVNPIIFGLADINNDYIVKYENI
jgi:hypothetical protein